MNSIVFLQQTSSRCNRVINIACDLHLIKIHRLEALLVRPKGCALSPETWWQKAFCRATSPSSIPSSSGVSTSIRDLARVCWTSQETVILFA